MAFSPKRGEIYYVKPNYAEFGHEMQAGRPAIIVSGNELNASHNCVEVVYLTTRPRRKMATHVLIHATGRMSTALCEQITTVDKYRLSGEPVRCTPKEMFMIDAAIKNSLGLPEEEENSTAEPPPEYSAGFAQMVLPLCASPEDPLRIAAERDIYKELYYDFLDRLLIPE